MTFFLDFQIRRDLAVRSGRHFGTPDAVVLNLVHSSKAAPQRANARGPEDTAGGVSMTDRTSDDPVRVNGR
jgi:hypothetical protein